MCDSTIGSVQFAALIDTLRIFLFSMAVMIKIKCEKQILRFAQDDNHFRHSRAGGNPAPLKQDALLQKHLEKNVFVWLDSRLRGNDGHVGNLDGA
mgnify:CR=1 FL=1